jgi:peroxiredoxin
MLKRLLLSALLLTMPALAATPDVGDRAPDFTLSTPEGASIRLSALTSKTTTVLVVLRGYPGYQCPYCQRQVQDFISHASDFAKGGAQVLLVYPGPPADLAGHAREFLDKRTLPDNVHLVIDPDYNFTKRYDLRWDAPHETAYPSTFVINRGGVITFRKISHEHGDRTTAQDMLEKLTSRSTP